MDNVSVFVPRSRKEANQNLESFILFCRYELKIYEPNFDWDDSNWKPPGVTFANIDQGKGPKDSKLLMERPFIDFAKAYFRYRQTHRPNKHHTELRALKCVERALLQITASADPNCIDPFILDTAGQLAREYYKEPYPVGREIAALATFLNEHSLTAHALDWANPFTRPTSVERTGVAANRKREEKLPTNDAIDALAQIFADRPTSHSDIFTTSIVALLLCAPTRIGEVLLLPSDCEVEEVKKNGTVAFGLRYRPKKGGDPMIKWIPDVMVDVAKDALARLREISRPAREFAQWVETGELMPPSLVEFLVQSHEDSSQDAKGLVGSNPPGQLLKEFKGHHLSPESLLESFRKSITIEHPHFPFIDASKTLRWSEALIVYNAYQLRRDKSPLSLRLWKPSNNTLNDRLGAKPGYSIFDVYGFTGSDGRPIQVTSHQFRHYVITIASRGGLSSSEIARWRSSKDARQNRAYIHLTEYEIAAMIKSNDPAILASKSEAEIAEQIAVALPMTTQEFNALARTTAHITELGFCLHDFVMSPCARFRDCINCTEHACVKGDRRAYRITEKLAIVEELLAEAEAGNKDGLYGADRWTEILRLTRDRMLELVRLIGCPEIPDGSVIRLANENEFSPIKRALGIRGLDFSKNRELGRRGLS